MAAHTNFTAHDVGELHRVFSRPLERIVRRDVRASEAVIEDACQFAWGRLVHSCPCVCKEAAFAWLATTAIREARAANQRDQRELSLDAQIELGGTMAAPAVQGPGPDELAERRERLESIRALPTRQQRLLWLQGFGLSYEEMAAHEGCTRRTVERQLLRAKGTLRRAA